MRREGKPLGSGKVSCGRGGNLVRAALSPKALAYISKGMKNSKASTHMSVTQDLLGYKAECLAGNMSKEPI